MKQGYNVLVDAFWGSSGKGKLALALADRYPITHCASSNLPNAGHTVVIGGRKIVNKVLPSAANVALLPDHQNAAEVWISPASAFWWRQLVKEWEEAHQPVINIHNRAIMMHEEFVEDEEQRQSLLGIASTCQGAGAAQVARMQRRPVLVRDNEHIFRMQPRVAMGNIHICEPQPFAADVRDSVEAGDTWLHEVSQGFALGLLYGTQYPQCTSRECSAIQAIADMGLPPWAAADGDIYLNVRSFPIRVGNTEAGNSGAWWGDADETTLLAVLDDAGAPPEVVEEYRKIETTTVTKRARRFCTMSWEWLRIAAAQNGATKLALNFAQYIDWSDLGCKKKDDLSPKTRNFIRMMQETTELPVVWVGTGPNHEDQVWLD